MVLRPVRPLSNVTPVNEPPPILDTVTFLGRKPPRPPQIGRRQGNTPAPPVPFEVVRQVVIEVARVAPPPRPTPP